MSLTVKSLLKGEEYFQSRLPVFSQPCGHAHSDTIDANDVLSLKVTGELCRGF